MYIIIARIDCVTVMPNSTVSWLMISMLSAMTVIWTNIFYVNTAFMILLISTVVCSSVVCGVFGDLFPTHLRYVKYDFITYYDKTCGSSNYFKFLFAERWQ